MVFDNFHIWNCRKHPGLIGLSDFQLQNEFSFFHWIGLRENLQETMVFTIKYRKLDGLSGEHFPIFPIIQGTMI